jgi:ABC-type glycerol-3-phosphate transport system permease component
MRGLSRTAPARRAFRLTGIAGACALAAAAAGSSSSSSPGSEHLMMISQGLTEFQGQISGTACNLLLAGSLIAVIPVLIVAMFAQRKIVESLTIGAVR